MKHPRPRIRPILALLLAALLTGCSAGAGSSAAPHSSAPASSVQPASPSTTPQSVHLTQADTVTAHRNLICGAARIDENGKIVLSANADDVQNQPGVEQLAGMDAISIFRSYDARYVLQPDGTMRVFYDRRISYEQMGVDRDAVAAFYTTLDAQLQTMSVADFQYSDEPPCCLLRLTNGDVYEIVPDSVFRKIADNAAVIRSDGILFRDGRLAQYIAGELRDVPGDWHNAVDFAIVGGYAVGLCADGSLQTALAQPELAELGFYLSIPDVPVLSLLPEIWSARTADHQLVRIWAHRDEVLPDQIPVCDPDAVAVYTSDFAYNLLPDGTMTPIRLSGGWDSVAAWIGTWGSDPVRTKMPIQ